jgi:serpin B
MTRRELISRLPIGLALARLAPVMGQGRPKPMDSVCGGGAGYDAQKWAKCVAAAEIAVAAQKSFGVHLLRDMVEHAPGRNVFMSPLSVFLALQMTENGAAGATRAAMRKALELPDLEAATLNGAAAALMSVLKTRSGAGLLIANALWADGHYPLAPEFVKLSASVYDASARSLNFADPKAASAINDWVKTNTKGKIPNIVTPEMVRAAAVILTNAVYFAGLWQHEFPESQTRDEVFHKTGGGTKTIPMMHQAGLTSGYRKGNGFECARLDYEGSGAFFCALLPQPGTAPKDVLASLDPKHLTGEPADFDLDLKLPRFSLDFNAGLRGYLEKMGMGIAFQYPQADFGPMGSRQFYLSEVIHKTRLEVDEKGTVAAAATAVLALAGARYLPPRPRPIKTLVFDRPFVVLIGDSQTDAVLFAGVIEEP